MKEHVGKMCPFCRTEIREEDAVAVCPACGIAHHKGCWEENGGCTTFGCSQQNYEQPNTAPNAFCANCGTPLENGDYFCPNCGAAKGAPKKNRCGKCGTELEEGQLFCANCGQRAGVAVDSTVNQAINQFNANVVMQQQKKKKSSKAVPIIIAAVLVVVLCVSLAVGGMLRERQAEKLKEEYLENVEEFISLSLTAGANLEDITDTIQLYWYENIWEDKHGSDINDAIWWATYDKSAELALAETYDVQMRALYAEIKRVPDGISGEDEDELEDICDAVIDLFNVYTELYNLATDPSGSYNSYSEANGDTVDEYIDCYNAVDNLLN